MFWNKSVNVEFAEYTNIGERSVNEDSIRTAKKNESGYAVLCDGLGGHGMGDAASKLVTDVFASCYEENSDLKTFLEKSFEAGQDCLLAEQKRLDCESKMKTTCVAFAFEKTTARWGHIGDSRLYMFENGKVKTRTLDHSIPQMLVMTGEIKESEIRHHPDRNIVLRVMGNPWEKKMYEVGKKTALKKGQAFLLCSDGFWENIEEEVMCEYLKKSSSVKEWLDYMSKTAHENGMGTNMDNNSAIAVWVQ